MSVEKEPIDEDEFRRVLAATGGMRRCNDAFNVIKLLWFTGMHISVLCNRKYDLHVKGDHLVWKRTKKKGKAAHTSILIAKPILNIEKFIKDVQKRKRRNNRQYFYEIIAEAGMRAGINGLSPMSFRHSLAVQLLQKGVERGKVQQILNCSDATLRRYGKYRTKDLDETLKQIGW